MITRFSIKYIITFSFYILFVSCISDAERDNPLDVHGHGTYFNLNGVVYTYYPPHRIIKNTTLLLQPIDRIVSSDQNGIYQFENIPSGNYTLICKADSFAYDTVTIEISSDTKHNFFLNGLPVIKKIKLTTHHVSRWFPVEDIYFLELKAEADDVDGVGDINSVYYKIPSLSFTDTLKVDFTPGAFTAQLFENELPVNSLHSLIGKAFVLYAEDKPGKTVTSDEHFLTRIIEETPVLNAPVQMQKVSSFPVNFQWGSIYLPYKSTFKIELFRIDINIFTKVDEIVDLPSNLNLYSYNSGLTAADYYWVLFIIDEFGNSSRSKEGAFVVE